MQVLNCTLEPAGDPGSLRQFAADARPREAVRLHPSRPRAAGRRRANPTPRSRLQPPPPPPRPPAPPAMAAGHLPALLLRALPHPGRAHTPCQRRRLLLRLPARIAGPGLCRGGSRGRSTHGPAQAGEPAAPRARAAADGTGAEGAAEPRCTSALRVPADPTRSGPEPCKLTASPAP